LKTEGGKSEELNGRGGGSSVQRGSEKEMGKDGFISGRQKKEGKRFRYKYS
jgi:hypothetical protein